MQDPMIGRVVVTYNHVERREEAGIIVRVEFGWSAVDDAEHTFCTVQWPDNVTTRHTIDELSAIAGRTELTIDR